MEDKMESFEVHSEGGAGTPDEDYVMMDAPLKGVFFYDGESGLIDHERIRDKVKRFTKKSNRNGVEEIVLDDPIILGNPKPRRKRKSRPTQLGVGTGELDKPTDVMSEAYESYSRIDRSLQEDRSGFHQEISLAGKGGVMITDDEILKTNCIERYKAVAREGADQDLLEEFEGDQDTLPGQGVPDTLLGVGPAEPVSSSDAFVTEVERQAAELGPNDPTVQIKYENLADGTIEEDKPTEKSGLSLLSMFGKALGGMVRGKKKATGESGIFVGSGKLSKQELPEWVAKDHAPPVPENYDQQQKEENSVMKNLDEIRQIHRERQESSENTPVEIPPGSYSDRMMKQASEAMESIMQTEKTVVSSNQTVQQSTAQGEIDNSLEETTDAAILEQIKTPRRWKQTIVAVGLAAFSIAGAFYAASTRGTSPNAGDGYNLSKPAVESVASNKSIAPAYTDNLKNPVLASAADEAKPDPFQPVPKTVGEEQQIYLTFAGLLDQGVGLSNNPDYNLEGKLTNQNVINIVLKDMFKDYDAYTKYTNAADFAKARYGINLPELGKDRAAEFTMANIDLQLRDDTKKRLEQERKERLVAKKAGGEAKSYDATKVGGVKDEPAPLLKIRTPADQKAKDTLDMLDKKHDKPSSYLDNIEREIQEDNNDVLKRMSGYHKEELSSIDQIRDNLESGGDDWDGIFAEVELPSYSKSGEVEEKKVIVDSNYLNAVSEAKTAVDADYLKEAKKAEWDEIDAGWDGILGNEVSGSIEMPKLYQVDSMVKSEPSVVVDKNLNAYQKEEPKVIIDLAA